MDNGATRRVLVIDDDSHLRALVRTSLEPEFDVVEACDGRDGLRVFYEQRPDLVILDARMPDLDGWETLRRIRDLADTPIIMLTALSSDRSLIRGLDSGADDYVTKPFNPSALSARVRANLRRSGAGSAAEPDRLSLDGGRLVIDRAAGQVWVRGQEVSLSATEYRLLVYLAEQADRVLTPTQILEHVWGYEYRTAVEYVKNYVRLLRSKIEENPRAPRYIVSRRGLGYLLVANPGESRPPDVDDSGEPIGPVS